MKILNTNLLVVLLVKRFIINFNFIKNLEIKSPPVLYLDFSNKQKEDNAINLVKLQEMQRQLNEALKKNKLIEENYSTLNDEVMKYKRLIKNSI